MAQDLKVGQFWRDTVNGDVLKIREIDEWVGDGPKPAYSSTDSAGFMAYVRCACYPRGEYYLGIQEMKATHLLTSRYILMNPGWLTALWYRWKFRKP